ncbi:MAG TPA: ABC transporter ATP-binding protein [Nitrososphaerales archaeon]|nr:ABC transporter ATP-binding protein [Nitrososphaerales archaeon]
MMDEPRQIATSVPSLEVRGLKVVFNTYAGVVKALDGIDLTVYRREVVGLVGESGCGKSVTALAIAGLLPENAKVLSGEVLLHGEDLLKKDKKQIRQARLTDIALVFQDPMTYLNPVMTIGSQITEIFTGNLKMFEDELVRSRVETLSREIKEDPDKAESLQGERDKLQNALASEPGKKIGKKEGRRLARLRAIEYLRLVRLPEPERVFKMYPFELSGGMRQRAMIAMALVRRPKVLLADEITTALDVTVQAQILKLLKELRDKIDASIILITHDLGVVAETCDRVAVMYAGNIVEVADVFEIFKNPLHPYTKGLFAAVPKPDVSAGEELESIKGSVPNLIFPPTGCRFHPRCPMAFEKCPRVKPPLIEVAAGHKVACLLYGG